MSIQQLNETMQELKANLELLESINQQCQNCTPSEYRRLDQQALRIMRANTRLTRAIRNLTNELTGEPQ
ncbi:hypothetical protein QP944_10540 [Corynebacterium sp. MSK105]|uniref:hypothetical protein n=1 Tax=unclassified Corynebacterium TaxID=2624378 RepID=UPI00254B90F0|nr:MULTISPECIES: hypothetical protein [unclassified Corynebacterium]MDK8483538.1 hypothetical protein [Corynebacterium sp. MSK074]MDK8690967.1 hypothetical protein [Corynebacterium sp. MSK105]